jgi:Tol biopolymer transport system component
VAVVTTGLLVRGTLGSPERRSLRFSIGAPGSARFLGGSLSPDGAWVAVVAEGDGPGVTRLWLKPLDAQGGSPRVVPESEGAARPFWSPDGQWVGFFANGRLKKVSVDGGPVQTLASFTGPRPSGGAWGPDGTILYASYMSGIMALPPAGQAPQKLTALNPDGRDIGHRWPHFTGDGRHFVYTVVSIDVERAGTYLASLDSPERTRLVPVQGAIWAEPGYLVYVRDGLLMAQRVDVARGEVTGSPFTLSGEAQAPGATNEASLSVSANGLLAFSAASSRRARLEWVSRSGQPLSIVQAPTNLYNPSLSPDRRTLMAGTGRDIWLVDLERNAPTRMGPGNTTSFSPDGLRVAFTSGPGGGLSELHIRDAVGATDSRLLLSSPDNKIVTAWSPDGRFIVYCAMDPSNQWDIWAVDANEAAAPTRVLATPFNECQGHVSPDGRWLAYSSDESGTSEIYVQAFPAGGSKRAVSVGGGSEPQWRPDGRELYYVAADGTLTSVQFDPTTGTPVQHPVPLFRIPLEVAELNTRRNHYVVGDRGQRFLVSSVDAERDSFGVLLDWTAGLR